MSAYVMGMVDEYPHSL